jgi:hypothetical protein
MFRESLLVFNQLYNFSKSSLIVVFKAATLLATYVDVVSSAKV